MPPTHRSWIGSLLSVAALAASSATIAQQPANTIRLVLGYPAGASSDALTRVVAEP